ncbi:hypothetical protein [Pseudomonas putida]|uniref:hypothetical protein n=1 Tax=Pseudomonas putida TaxID=303 RepID=UPI0022DE18F8|nr:hypothetical protein [Pseudomonas putida]WBM49627.1 hypothetical protein M2J85_19395 [Pseudomonas putida]
MISLKTEPFNLLGWSPFIHSLLMGTDGLESLLQERLAGLCHAKGSFSSSRFLTAMGAQVLKLLVPHGHELLEVAQIRPLRQAGRATLAAWKRCSYGIGDAFLHDQLNAVVELRGHDNDELLGRELITAHDALQGLVNLVEFSQHLFSASVSRL